ncbi:MAG: hypothetical protein ABI831_02230 [Betaproteobacteria bacterium]
MIGINSHYPFYTVLMGGCDKTVPAQLMGDASAGIPAIELRLKIEAVDQRGDVNAVGWAAVVLTRRA